MRTTIEIADEHRAQLLELAARRGEKGFSKLVDEAIARYLREVRGNDERVKAALGVLGTLDDEAAEHMLETSRGLRATWR